MTQIYRCKQTSQVDANKFSAKSYFIYNEKKQKYIFKACVMTIKTNKHDKTYQEQMPKSFFQKGCCNHYLYTVYNTTSFF